MINDYFESEIFKATLQNYEKCMSDDGVVYLDAEDFMDIADYYMSLGRYDKAEECVNLAMSQHPDDDGVMAVCCSCYICQKRFEEANALHKRMDATMPDVMYQRAQIQYALNHNYDKATEIWRKWMKIVLEDDNSADTERDCYAHVIASVLELREYSAFEISDEDSEYLNLWLDEYVDKFAPLGESDYDEVIADSFIATLMPDTVIAWYNPILERRPYMTRGWSRLSVAYLVKEDFASCIEAADFALAVNPDDLDALTAKANALLYLKEWDETLALHKELREKGGGKIHNLNMATAYFKTGDPTKAFLCLKELKDELDKYLEMLESGEETVLRNVPQPLEGLGYGDYTMFYVQLCLDIADRLRTNGYYKESNPYLKAALKYDTENYYIYTYLAENCIFDNDCEQSLKYFRKSMDYCGVEHRVEIGVKLAMYLIANSSPSHCEELLKKCEAFDNLTKKEMGLIASAYTYLYLFLEDEEKFLYHYDCFLKLNSGVNDAFELFMPKGLSVDETLDYARKHFLEIKNLVFNRLSSDGELPLDGELI